MARQPQFPPGVEPTLSHRLDHATRTAHEVRQDRVFSAEIVDSAPANASGTVKTFAFQLRPLGASPSSPTPSRTRFSFLPGQWLDVFIPSVPIVGGFSLVSSPSLAERQGRFELAIRNSRHPPAAWFHAQDRKGDMIDVRIGGGFTYPPTVGRREEVPDHDEIVFISGGVGLNTTLSILRSLNDLYPLSPSSPPGLPPRRPSTTLLYSSKPQELLFLPELPKVIDPGDVRLFLTGPSSDTDPSGALPPECKPFHNQHWRRIVLDDVVQTLQPRHPDRARRKLWYVCGPPAMTDAVVGWLRHDLGVDRSRVLLEKWW